MLSSRADTHLFAGALGTNQNDRLFFSNGSAFDATLGTFSFPQVLRTNGLNAGHYRGEVITFTALAAEPENGGPIPGHAAFGAQLAIQVVSLEGPPGGSFAFWEGDGESDLGAITFSIPVGATNGTNSFLVSENGGTPNTDPYGHIHGRQFTTSRLGTYLVGFRVIDVSTNGAAGGPVHTPSEILKVRFQAGLRLEAIQRLTNRVNVSFRSPPGISNVVEGSDALSTGIWQPIAPALRGNNNVQTSVDTNPPAAGRFYRLRQLNVLP